MIGGGERQAQSLAEDLVRHGRQAMVLTRRTDTRLPAMEAINGVRVERIPPAGAIRAARWRMVWFALRVLVRRRREYDVILVAGFKALGIPAVLAARLFGKRCVLKADSNGEMSGAFFAGGLKSLGMSPRSPAVRAFVGLRNVLLRRADRFVAITPGIEQELEAAGVEPGRIRRVTNSVDTSTYRPVTPDVRERIRRQLGLSPSDVVLVYTGRLVSYKGLPRLLTVIEDIARRDPRVKLVLVGAGGLDMHNCEEGLRRFVSERRLGDTIRFAGEVTSVHEYLQASDVFVLPSEDDAFPLSLVEAMACGLPVIATKVGGIAGIVTPGVDGLLIEPGDSSQLDEALCRVIRDGALASALGAAAARTVRARYSRERVADQYMQLFDEAVR